MLVSLFVPYRSVRQRATVFWCTRSLCASPYIRSNCHTEDIPSPVLCWVGLWGVQKQRLLTFHWCFTRISIMLFIVLCFWVKGHVCELLGRKLPVSFPCFYRLTECMLIGKWLVIIESSLTCAVADALVFDNIVTVQGADGLDFSLEVCHRGLFVWLKFLDSNQISSVITPRIITTKLNTAEVTLNTHMHAVKTFIFLS